MGLNKINFSVAEKIIDRYIQLLENLPNQLPFDKYGYGAMGGYDLQDIANALCLMTAYRVKNAYNFDRINLEKFKKLAQEDAVARLQYFSHFIPDNEKAELDKLDKLSPDFLRNSIIVQSDIREGEAWKNLMKNETTQSFLNYCIYIKERDINRYWHLVFQRLKIQCDDSKEYDRIYYEFNSEKDTSGNQVKEPDLKPKPSRKQSVHPAVGSNISVKQIPNRIIYDPIKTALFHLFFIGILLWSVSNITVRVISFWFIILFCLFLIAFSIKERLTKTMFQKYKLGMDVFIVIILVIGLWHPEIGFYAAIFTFSLQVIGLLELLFKKYFSANKASHPD
jgi:hypothetical protein